MAKVVSRLLAEMEPNGRSELRREFAGPGWRGPFWASTNAVTRVTAGEAVSVAGREAFAALRGLSDDEIVSNAAVLLFGGSETAEGMIANALYFLLTNGEETAVFTNIW